jgi:hypothetical protein
VVTATFDVVWQELNQQKLWRKRLRTG